MCPSRALLGLGGPRRWEAHGEVHQPRRWEPHVEVLSLRIMSSAPFRLSVLDQSPVSEGSSGAQALQNTIDLARLADRLGYHRYWVAEHHGGPMLAGPSPEALIGPIAAATERLTNLLFVRGDASAAAAAG